MMPNPAVVSSAPGWFGKIASLGDFASRRLPPGAVQACDRWLSDSVSQSRAQLGEGWLQAYLSAPVWRFAWAPQVVDGQWWFGVLMPSCDKVGRYFPLLVAQLRPAPPAGRDAQDHLELWWTQAAQAALQTLDEGSDLPAFEQALAALPPWPDAAQPEVLSEVTLVDLGGGMSWAGLQGHSVWWPWRPLGAVAPRRVVPGLPEPALFAGMLSTAV